MRYLLPVTTALALLGSATIGMPLSDALAAVSPPEDLRASPTISNERKADEILD